MIDTDKYEVDGQWTVGVRKGTFTVMNGLEEVAAMNDYAHAQLIADAPLLLEEVKRLREDNKKLHDAINGCAYANMQGSALDLYCESIEGCEEE